MITVKNGYTLSECSQQEYTYRYQAMPSSVQRAVSAPEFSIIEESEDSSALALYTLQGDIIKVNNGVAFTESPFDIHNSEITITAIVEDTQTPAGVAICGIVNNDQTVLVYDRFDITIFSIKMFDAQNILIHDLTPAQSKVTERGGLYDIITGTFYPADSKYNDFVKEAIV